MHFWGTSIWVGREKKCLLLQVRRCSIIWQPLIFIRMVNLSISWDLVLASMIWLVWLLMALILLGSCSRSPFYPFVGDYLYFFVQHFCVFIFLFYILSNFIVFENLQIHFWTLISNWFKLTWKISFITKKCKI